MAKRTRYTRVSEVVLEALSGESSQAEVCPLSEQRCPKWKQQAIENDPR